MAPRSKQILLVDFDVAAFKYGWTHELAIDWQDGTTSTRIELEQAKYGIGQFIEKLRVRCKCGKVILFVTGAFNFRYAVLPTYKHNRQDVVKPRLIDALKKWAAEEYEVVSVRGLEADDLLGIYATRDPEGTVVATVDKDLKQIPCNLYLWNHDTLERITLDDADLWFYRQILTGDSTDGYTGVPGIGPKRAERILAETPRENWWDAILGAYANKGMTEEDALQQARVARILRDEDFDPKAQAPILWTP